MAVKELGEFEAQKKKLIRKKKKLRAKRRFIVLLFLLICIGTIFVVLKAPFFNVKTIVCVGQTSLSREEVIEIAGAKIDVNIFSTGVGTMKRRLAAHPNIAESNVRRLFPNKIKIWIREAKPVVRIEQNGTILLAEKHGQIIKSLDEKTKVEAEGIARLLNFEPSSTDVGGYIFNKEDVVHNVTYECIDILASLGMIEQITEIDATNLSDIKIEYQDRLTVLLGSYEQMEYKLTFIKKVIDENISKYEKAILDYRGSKLYVGPKNAEETEPPLQEDDENTETEKFVEEEIKSEQITDEN